MTNDEIRMTKGNIRVSRVVFGVPPKTDDVGIPLFARDALPRRPEALRYPSSFHPSPSVFIRG